MMGYATLHPSCDFRVMLKQVKENIEMSAIVDVVAREILDSRGNPTVEALF